MSQAKIDQFRTSFAQQRLWFLEQYQPSASLYNIPVACRISGPLNHEVLEQCLEVIISRHETLRTTFSIDEDEPVQRISPPVKYVLPVIDISNEKNREECAISIAEEEALRPFDLEKGPLIRTKLLCLDEQEHIFLLTLHHIVSDGWSMGVLLHELSSCYHALNSDQRLLLNELPIQYADFAEWQRNQLTGDILAKQVSYWTHTLAEAPPLLALPTDRPRPVNRSSKGAVTRFNLGKSLSDRLRQLSLRQNATLFMTLATAFSILLHRYSRQDDLCIGYPVAGRNQPEVEGLIGFFVNTLVLRTRFDPNHSFEELLSQVRDSILGAGDHQDLPFEKLVEEMKVDRSLNYSPLFQVLFAFYETDQTTMLKLPQLQTEVIPNKALGAKFDLSLELVVRDGSLCGAFEYATDLFDASTINRLMRHYQVLLESIVKEPLAKVSDLPLLTFAERSQLLEDWNNTENEIPTECIHRLFEQQVARTPTATAVEYAGELLTYQELNARANQLAHHLRGLKVGPDTLVALCVERNLDMAVGILGILKAGAAYVPLDPDYPKARLNWMLTDTATPVLLTQKALAEKLPSHDGVLYLDAQWPDVAKQPDVDLLTEVTPRHLAYCIYTSGSTGTPKGTANTHEGFSNLAKWYASEELAGSERVMLSSSLSFDLTQKNILGTWLAGGTLIIPNAGAADAEGFRQALFEQMPTRINCAPSAFRAYLSEHPIPESLCLVMLGGEPIDTTLYESLSAQGVALVNSYGPTECADVATSYIQLAGETVSEIPLGRPIPNVQTYLLDNELNPVPVGVTGEIYIAGVGVARGYLNRPELTAECFLPNPFGSAGSRMYKTGDLGRYLANGNLIFLGRADHQVKLRGLRIELGEIENLLLGFDQVRESVVLLGKSVFGEDCLIAYVVGNFEVEELRSELLAQLPAYMVPSAWVKLDKLPLNPNGKVDREALPKPDKSERGKKYSYVEPKTPTETTLAHIWAEVLGLDRVGVHDNFFELGGHSLLAAQVVSRIRRELSVELPLRQLFESPSIAQLVERLDIEMDEALAPIAATAAGPGRKSVSFSQERLFFLHQLEPESATYNIPVAFSLSGPLNVGALERSFEELVLRHEALRTTFSQDEQGQVIAVVHASLMQRLKLEVHGGISERAVLELAEQEAMTPFELDQGPLLRVRLLQLEVERYLLLLTLHHIVADAWSIEVLVQEVMELYKAYAAGRASSLPALPIQYSDYAAWQKQWLDDEKLAAQLSFWQEHLADAPVSLELPTDRPRPAVQSSHGAVFSRPLGRELSAAVDRLAKQLDATPFMVLLAAFNVLLGRYANQYDIIVGTPIANRNHAETEPLIGLFINTLALRTDLNGQPSFAELVTRTRSITLSAYSNQDLPFEKVVEVLKLPRDLSRSPLFQVMFTLHNSTLPEFELPGINASMLPLEAQIAKFDLMLNVIPSDDGYHARWEFNTDLFDQTTVERKAVHFETLLKDAVKEPRSQIGLLNILTKNERHQILSVWNDTEKPHDSILAHQLFQSTVLRMPDAEAVRDGSHSLSYDELNKCSNQFACYLRSAGVVPHSLVGLCLNRSIDIAVAILGVLKAGAACVPMDPSYPVERLRFMAQDTRSPVIVTHSALRERVGKCDAQFICIDDCPNAWNEPDTDIQVVMDVESICYVLYTSGSTGRPKGVALPHRMLTNLVQWQLAESDLKFGARTIQFSPLSFDVSFDEFFSTWAAGGTVVIVSEEVRRDPVKLLQLIQSEKVSRLFIPFVALQGIADAASQASELLDLREIVCGGEQLQITDEVVDFYHKLPNALLHNQYGPTESHFVTGHRLTGDPGCWARLPPIGKPIDNNRIYLLDKYLQPVPIGVHADLYIAGANLAHGYWKRADLTADCFLPDPFCKTPGGRMYRTGDKARYLENGDIEYLGRADHQVKVRGFRIELAEVEQALVSVDAVVAASANVQEGHHGIKKLVGYVVAKPGIILNVHAIRDKLSQHLPEYMVPNVIVELSALPLTPSGKVDRKALPISDEIDASTEYVAPTTPTERTLAHIWSEVLGLDRVGVHDNFFELGGHSLLAAQVVSRIRREISAELPLRQLFEYPSIAQLVERLDIEMDDALAPIVATAAGPGRKSVSFSQERLFFLHQLEPESATYNIPVAFSLSGSLNVGALERSFEELVQRHEALRTTFSQDEQGQVIAVVHASLIQRLKLEVHGGISERAVLELAEQEAMTPFELDQGPLLRVRLLQLEVERYLLLLTLHHIVADAWSIEVLVQEVMELYKAYAAGRASSLPALPIQYSDYAAWQKQWLDDEKLAAQLSFWQEHLADAPVSLELPTDRPRPAVQSSHGAVFSRPLGRELSAAVDRLAKQLDATPFMVLLAAFNVLLGRYANQDDIIVGTPIANRNHAETEPLIGLFINTLALRTDLNGQPSFAELVTRTRSITLSAYSNQDLPFEKVVEVLKLPRDLSRSPLFQVMFTLHNSTLPEFELPGINASMLPLEAQIAKFDLMLNVIPSDDGYHARWEFNTDLFDQTTIERKAGHFENLLKAATKEPEAQIGRLNILTEDERYQIVNLWGGQEDICDADTCLIEMFRLQVHQSPESIAVLCDSESVSYGELFARASSIAAHLQAHGIGKESRVGVCLERSVGMVATLLGVLMAGGAYVPLDPSYPSERLEYMLTDAGCSVVVVQRQTAEIFKDNLVKPVLLEELEVNQRMLLECCYKTDPSLTAYVIYTSGSTGQPKGVQISRRSLSNFLASMAIHPGLTSLDTLLAVTSISFDIAALEIYLPLVVGAKLVLADRDSAADGERLISLANKNNVTVMQATPSTFWLMLSAGWPESHSLKVLCGGEALPDALREELLPRTNELWNMYGPTETTIWSTVKKIQNTSTSIGRPIDNTVVRVLNENSQLCPIGVPGELHIGGAGVAYGYVGQPEKTAESFVPDPINYHSDTRLYRTGDLVRWLPDGDLEYLGRLDHQVKLRGYRIELGEIESCLAQHPAVQQAVIVLHKYSERDHRLVAYLVCEEIIPLTSELRTYLMQTLPNYMIPAAFVSLSALPLTQNGKVDRKALPIPELPDEVNNHVLPENDLEKKLACLWQELLKVNQVSRSDNFFELGGHSLMAIQLVARIRNELGLCLSMKDVFETQTLSELAARLVAPSTLQSNLGIKLRDGESPKLFLIHPVGGGVSAYREIVQMLPSEFGVVAFQASGLEGLATPLDSVASMAAKYLEELLNIQPQGPFRLSGWSMGGLVAYEMACLLEKLGHTVELLALLDTSSPDENRHLQVPGWPLGEYLLDLSSAYNKSHELNNGDIKKLEEDPDRDALAIDMAHRSGLLPMSIDRTSLNRRLAVFSANQYAMQHYLPEEVFSGKIFLIQANQGDPIGMGWDAWTANELVAISVPGTHYSMLPTAGYVLCNILHGVVMNDDSIALEYDASYNHETPE